MALLTCPECGQVIYGDSSEVKRMLKEHIRRVHEQGYRRVDSWRDCSNCFGHGKVGGVDCPYCGGSGKV